MSTIVWVECPTCEYRGRVEMGSDRHGRTLEIPVDLCEHQRKARSLCADCDSPPRSPKALRCAPCAEKRNRERSRAAGLRYRWKHIDKVRARGRETARKAQRERREELATRKREAYQRDKERLSREARKKRLRGDPAYERAKERTREYRRKHKDRLNARRREYYWANRETILAERKANRVFERRKKAAKEAMRRAA